MTTKVAPSVTSMPSQISPEAAVDRSAARSPARPRAAWLAMLAPAVLMLWSLYAVWVTYSPTPYVDQWTELARWRAIGTTGWRAYLFAQHNEHRIFFPRLVFTADWGWFRGREILSLIAVWLAQLSGAALLVRCAEVRRAGALGLVGLATALCLLFSLMQWQNLNWGFQVQFVGVYAAAGWALYVFCCASQDPRQLRWGALAGAIALLVVASFSMANGMLAGVVMILVALVARRGRPAALIAGVATAIVVAVYLHGYHATPPMRAYETVAGHAQPASLARHLWRIVIYFPAFLGAIWWPDHAVPAVLFGVTGAALTAGMALIVARDRGRETMDAALLGVALFVGMSASMTAVGRGELGLWSAFSSRYMTPIAYFWAAHAIFWSRRAGRDAWRAGRAATGALLVLAMLRLVMLQPVAFEDALAIHRGVVLGSSALLGEVGDGTALLNVAVFTDGRVFADDVGYLRTQRLALFADPPVATTGSAFQRPLAPTGACRGAFVSLVQAPPWLGRPTAAGRAAGWGWDVQARRPFSRVVFVDSVGRTIGIGLSGVERPGADATPWPGRDATSGWIASINRGAGPEVTAYGVTARGLACRLGRKAWPP